MNFIEAVKLLQLDKNIKLRRRGKEITITLHPLGEHFMKDDSYSIYLTTVDDILAEDWYVVKDEKLHSFEEALKALKEGKTIKRKFSTAVYEHTVGANSIYPYQAAKYDRSRWVDISFTNDDILANDWIIIDKEETK